MKRITYLIVAMLMAFTMVGCQVDLSDYLTKEEADAKYATIAYVDGKVAELETKINEIDTKFADYYTKGEVDEKLEGYATKEDLATLGDISKAVKDYLETVDWNDYIEDGYTNDEIDEKINAIKEITDKLGNVETLLADVTNLKTRVTNLESTIEELNGKVTSLENKPTTPSGNGGDGYCGLSADEVTNIKTLLTQWANNNISGVVYSLAGYVKETDLAGYVKTKLDDYYSKADLDTILDGDTSNDKNFKDDLKAIVDRISKVENLLTIDDVLGKRLTELETKVNGKVDTTVFNTFKGNYESLSSMIADLNLAQYINPSLEGYATKGEVKKVEDALESLTSRVDTLNTTINATDGLVATVNTMKFVLGNTESGLVKDFNDLKKAVEDITKKLTYKISNEEYDIKKLAEKVDALKDIQTRYENYCREAIQGLATLTEVNEKLEGYAKTDMTNVDKQTVVNLVKEYVEGEVAEVTVDTSDFLTSDSLSNYATKTELASKLDASAINVTDITSRLATLETVEKKYFVKSLSGGEYKAYAYYKIGNSGFYIGYEGAKSSNTNDFTSFDSIISNSKNNSSAKLVVTTTPTLN